MCSPWTLRTAAIAALVLFLPNSARGQTPEKQQLASRVKAVFTKYCYGCHGQNGANEGSFNFVLDFKQLVGTKVVAGDPKQSRLFKRMGVNQSMPPEGVEPRPTEADITLVQKWIEAGAPIPEAEEEKARPFVGLKDELTALREFLKKKERGDRRFIRFFSLRHLSNLPADKLRNADLRIYQAALSKLVNSVSWREEIIVPEAADVGKTVYAIDIRNLDWDRENLWQEVLKLYPYALSHDVYPDDEEINNLAEEVYRDAGTKVPVVRADWFIATASRPPLYHTLVQIPAHARTLEQKLGVDVALNIREGKVKRAGFSGSGVSGHNRMVERHDTKYGAYWKSYDFKSSAGLGNLFIFPLGPRFPGNDFAKHAFQHAGGEIIFHLPNHLQGYMLVDDKDARINEGPIEVVNDSTKASGTPLVVNGLSCMSCHQHGMMRFKDQVRTGHILGGDARLFVARIYPDPKEMDQAVERDEKRFLAALDEAVGPFLKLGPDSGKEVRDFPEPIRAIARWYLVQELTSVEAARELGLGEAKLLEGHIAANPRLQGFGLFPLSRGHNLKREVWENTEFSFSPFQHAAKELKLGTPEVFR